jgi:8-oxo-dGTP pyrophosphatase MutT (NUDIX family)
VSDLPLVYFGPPDAAPNWRSEPDVGTDSDEELPETPADVISLLGFDPMEFSRADANGVMVLAAGVLFIAGKHPDETVLLVRRTNAGDHAGEWALPGGKIEDGETAAEAAERECEEELGLKFLPNDLTLHARQIKNGVDYTTFACRVPEPFEVDLNEEHDDARWVPLSEVTGEARGDTALNPKPPPGLPPGVKVERVETLDEGAGRYDAKTKTITLASRLKLGDGSTRELSNPDRLEAHEVGHAVDHSLGWVSHDDAFHGLLRAAWDRLTPEERIGAAYYFSSVEEAFAEAYATLAGPAEGARYFGTMEPDRAAEAMKEVLSWVKERVSRV